jgi:hypothetical protein
MESVLIAAIALGLLATWGIAAFAIVYVGARLAIRHERGVSN